MNEKGQKRDRELKGAEVLSTVGWRREKERGVLDFKRC
jgi:hypothetical protein